MKLAADGNALALPSASPPLGNAFRRCEISTYALFTSVSYGTAQRRLPRAATIFIAKKA